MNLTEINYSHNVYILVQSIFLKFVIIWPSVWQSPKLKFHLFYGTEGWFPYLAQLANSWKRLHKLSFLNLLILNETIFKVSFCHMKFLVKAKSKFYSSVGWNWGQISILGPAVQNQKSPYKFNSVNLLILNKTTLKILYCP